VLAAAVARAGMSDPATGQPLAYTPHDFRHLFITDAEMGIVASGASFGIFCERALLAVQHTARRRDRVEDRTRTMGDLGCHHPLASGRTMMQPVRLHPTPA
jgi:hypothetical protein